LFSELGTKGILFAAACGFTAGLVFNYFLSLVFVFKNIDEKAKRRKFFSFAVFTLIGIAGLGITELCMYAGVRFFGQERYLPVKIVTAAFVLMWNYTARKIFIFKGARIAAN
jgi:putative flippase GtrA